MTRCYINLLLTLIYKSKTKQDKSIAILIWNTIGKLASLILLPHSDPLPGRYLVSNKNICKYQYSILFNFGVRPSRPSSHRRCCQLLYTKCDARKPLFTIMALVLMTPKSKRRRIPAFFRGAIFLLSELRDRCVCHSVDLSSYRSVSMITHERVSGRPPNGSWKLFFGTSRFLV